MISDGNSSLRSGDFVRVGDERTSPTSYARTFECAGLMIRFQCTLRLRSNLLRWLIYLMDPVVDNLF